MDLGVAGRAWAWGNIREKKIKNNLENRVE